jgi:hypothetical protein
MRSFCLIGALADRGALEAARAEALRLAGSARVREVPSFEGRARWALGDVLLRSGDVDGAEREVRAALDRLRLPVERLAVEALLAAILLARGRAPLALAAAGEVEARYEALGGSGFRATFARLIHAEALVATGDRAGAAQALGEARDAILVRASRISDAALQRSFLERVPEHARLLALAGELCGPAPDPERRS